MADQPVKGPDEKFCSSCGVAIKKEAEICPKCGVRQPISGIPKAVSEEGAEFLPKAASCCVPIVGLVLFFVWKDSKPKASKDVCKWAIIGTVISVVLYVLSMALGLFSSFLGS